MGKAGFRSEEPSCSLKEAGHRGDVRPSLGSCVDTQLLRRGWRSQQVEEPDKDVGGRAPFPARHLGHVVWGDGALSSWTRGGSWAPPAHSCCLLWQSWSGCWEGKLTGSSLLDLCVFLLLRPKPRLLLEFSVKQGLGPLLPAWGGACLPPCSGWVGWSCPMGNFTQALESCPSATCLLPRPLQPCPSHPAPVGLTLGPPILTDTPLLHVLPEATPATLPEVSPLPIHLWVHLTAVP